MYLGIIASLFQKIMEFVTGFFAFIPMTIYFINASCASFLDFFQYLIRKLAGLDVYYVDGKAVEGDMLVAFVRGILGIDGGAQYSTLSTVFWSLIIFSVVLLILTTIIAIIKAHYNYDAKKSQPMAIITNSIKALMTMVVVPIVTLFSLYLSQVVLKYADMLTSAGSGTTISGVFGNDTSKLENFGQEGGATIYSSYDIFGFGNPTTSATFSGTIFKVSGYDCNRVRSGSYRVKTSSSFWYWSDLGVFVDPSGDKEALANRIDTAFANNLTLKERGTCTCVPIVQLDSGALSSAYLVGAGATWGGGLYFVKHFSKYNVGLVYYYYDLWTFNYFLQIAAIIFCIAPLFNMIMGLITRLITCLALFLVYSPTIGIIPLDGGNGFKSWKKEFIQNVLMTYGAIIGMNLFFLILPFLQSITFFAPGIFGGVGFLNQIMQLLFMIAGLTMLKKLTKLISTFVGGADAQETGKAVTDDIKQTGMKAAKPTLMAAKAGVMIGKMGIKANNKLFDASKNLKNSGKKGGKLFGTLGMIATGGGKGITSAAKGIGKVGGKIKDAKIRKDLGLEKDAAVTNEQRGQHAQMKKLRKLGNVDDKEIVKAFQSGDQNQINAIIKANNQAINDRRKQAGLDEVKEEDIGKDGIINEANPDGPINAGTAGALKSFGSGLLDLGGATIKLAGELTGISGLFKDIKKNTEVMDAGKDAIFTFGQAIGMFSAENKPKALQTKAESDAADKAALARQQEAQTNIAENTKKTLDAIKELQQTFEKKK